MLDLARDALVNLVTARKELCAGTVEIANNTLTWVGALQLMSSYKYASNCALLNAYSAASGHGIALQAREWC